MTPDSKDDSVLTVEITLHLNAPIDGAIYGVPALVEQDGNLLVHINEDLVFSLFALLLVPNWLLDGIRIDGVFLPRKLEHRLLHRGDCLRDYERFKLLSRDDLRVPIVDHLIQKLVN